MKVDITIPSMGESVVEAIVVKILKPTGQYVQADEEIVELETDKVNQVLFAPQAGQITLNVKIDDRVKIGQVIGQIETSVSVFREEVKPVISAPPPPVKAPVAASLGARKKMSSLRKLIATRLVEAKNSTAMLTTFNEVDLSSVMQVRTKEQESFKARYGVKLGLMSFFVKAASSALKQFPQVNSYIDGEEIVEFASYDIGVAVSTDRGLIVPVLRGCDSLSFGQIEQKIAAFAAKSRDGTISVDELRGGSFTITNGGIFGSLLSTPILNPPQSAILGMHAIVNRPVAIDNQVVIRPMMYLALTYDHRLIDGREAVLFLGYIKELLEDPSRLLLDL